MRCLEFLRTIPQTDHCIEWPFRSKVDGYGVLSVGNKMKRAHRVSYEIHVGEILGDLFVCHRCDNRACVNPRHLFLGTNSENVADMVAKGRQPKGSLNGQSKLTEEQAALIAADRRPFRAVAEDFGVSRWAVWNIRKGQSWARGAP